MKSVVSSKSGKLNQHFSSNSHKAALADFAHFAIKCSNVDVIMSKQAKEILIQEKADEEKNKEIILILLDMVRLSVSYLDTIQFLSHRLTISV